MKIEYKYIIMFILGIVLIQNGCDRNSNPVWSLPSPSLTSVSGVCTQVEVFDFPNNRAFCSIIDQNNNPLLDFKIGNFNVVEDGKPTVITEVKPVDNIADPLYVSIVLDRSGSMSETATNDANAAAIAFVNGLDPNDQAAIIDFASEATLVCGFTSDKSALIDVINSSEVGGMTALYDGIGLGVSEVSSKRGRKLVVAMTDGLENSSRTYTTSESIVEYANKNGISVYTVGFGGAPDYSLLEYIANETGGRSFQSDDSAGLQNIFEEILIQFKNLIEIHFRTRLSGSRQLKIYLTYGEHFGIFGRKYSS